MSKIALVHQAVVRNAVADEITPICNNPAPGDAAGESNWSPAALERVGSTLTALNRMARRPPVNMVFEDLTYTVGSGIGERKILNGVSGEFRSGELVCIIGPSGAGKSTLLNVLAGYSSNGVSGRIMVNGHARDMRVFKKLSSYIMQDDLLQQRLTVLEAMFIAADLKLGEEFGKAEKQLIVHEILQTIGLWNNRNTRTECLSGGQSKRLSVALELVNNPPILFLDEPTTGLDVVSIRQLVVLLRLLSRQGRTIICTIHQPSASLFALFDRIYVVAKGTCCYQGDPAQIVPFLTEVGYVCPTTHNPADFILEQIFCETDASSQLSEHCQNGKLSRKPVTQLRRGLRKPILRSDESMKRIFVDHVVREQLQKVDFPTTFLTQLFILSKRMFCQNRRNSMSLWIQFFHHTLSATLIGTIFLKIGNDGSLPIANFKFCLSCIVFFMYTHVMVPVLIFPNEVRLLRREYFNRWYSLKAYYTALTLSTLPVMILFGLLFNVITYIMSGQVMEFDRFILFSISGILTGLCSEGLGLAVGSIFNVTNGSIVGPATVAPLLALCCYGMGYGPSIETFMKVLMSASYLRYSVTGLSLALYENRERMDCNAEFCMYTNPQLILRDLGMANDVYYVQILVLLLFTVFHRLIAYFALRYRLTPEFTNKSMRYISKFLKHG